jgi:hypothetical protein
VGDASVQDIIEMTKAQGQRNTGRRVFDRDQKKVVYWGKRWKGAVIYEVLHDEGMADN